MPPRKRLDAVLAKPWLPHFPARLRAERTFIVEAYQAILDGREWGPTQRRPWYERLLRRVHNPHWSEPRRLRPGMAQTVVTVCDAMTEAAAQPYTSYVESTPRFQAPIAALDEAIAGLSPAFTALRDRLARTDAECRLARVALALAEQHAATGAWPAALDGLPLDPFTDAPFRYERTDTGVRLSSAGLSYAWNLGD